MKIRVRTRPRKHSRYVPKPKYPHEDGHRGFWLSDGEQSIHVYGDPNMSAETAHDLLQLAKLVGQAIERGEIKRHVKG